ncbi:HD domain-containing phosphohydrolase [Planctomicrobium piriforme]|uniref:Putative two-component system response regulator n=1 Tax=Planctomicrobium piriforme TaxID=1576369 RepID=A0A1I3NAY8_9PLAN|nr:HD domain-containing phosphohydrolase [Planctomicrobium piriforme]SFJ06382.1 putative two-component system response regulator [Planctomicrobium piriforme]
MKILVVDDDEIIRDLLQHLLEQEGYEVYLANDGTEALHILQKENCNLVILDWEMPGLSGPELCRAIRLGDFGGYVYLMLLTSKTTTDEFVEGMASGADEFVRKPFNAAELRMRVAAGIRVLSLETRDALIFTLAKLAESRDADTGMHLERVQRYSRALAQSLSKHSSYSQQIDFGYIRNLFLTSALHDIGKVGIPDNILLKPGRLTPEEFEMMKQHTIIGADTLQEAMNHHPHVKYLRMAYNIALYHHERWDGSGYPRKLAGNDIPLCARIVSLADVYDALTSKRVYKDAYTHEEARKIILESSGTHFDPEVVEAFLDCEPAFIEIKQQFNGDGTLEFDRLMCHA